ncbi:MAG TPA: hypothetical protein VFB96_04635 [Pirellulaceae bacterium]|nr:hypothetical protein [Pirellulaceae bacterium]
MRSAFGVAFVAIVWTVCGDVLATDLFVDNLAGDDRNNGQGVKVISRGNGPVRTIEKALRLAQAGDRIVINPNGGQPYRECITLQGGAHSGFGDVVLEIVGNGAVMDGSLSLVSADWEVVGEDLYAVQPPKMAYQQLFLGGQPAARVKPAGDKVPELQPRQWCLFKGRIVFRTDRGRRPESYDISCGGHPVAITLYEVHDLVIRDLKIRGYQLDGVNAHDNVTRCDLVGIDSSYNGRSGFSIGGASRVRLDGCTAGGNGAAQVRTEGFSKTHLVGGSFDETTAPALVQEGGKVTKE